MCQYDISRPNLINFKGFFASCEVTQKGLMTQGKKYLETSAQEEKGVLSLKQSRRLRFSLERPCCIITSWLNRCCSRIDGLLLSRSAAGQASSRSPLRVFLSLRSLVHHVFLTLAHVFWCKFVVSDCPGAG